MERLKHPGVVGMSPTVTTPEPVIPQESVPSPMKRAAAAGGNITDVLTEWFNSRNTEKIVVENGPSRIVIHSPFICDNETTIAFAFDPKLIAFSAPIHGEKESMITMELAFESRIKLSYRSGQNNVLFAGGLFLFPGLPFGIVSFFKMKEETP
jgi:hypothetical protein